MVEQGLTGASASEPGSRELDQQAVPALTGFDPSRKILLRCPKCRDSKEVERNDTDPPAAAEMWLICMSCDDGDFHDPIFTDATGKSVHPTEHLA